MTVGAVGSAAATLVPMTDVAEASASAVRTKHRATEAPEGVEEPAAKRARTESPSPITSRTAPPIYRVLPVLWLRAIFPFLGKMPFHPGESMVSLANRDLVALNSVSKGHHQRIQCYWKEAMARFVANYRPEIQRIEAQGARCADIARYLDACSGLQTISLKALSFQHSRISLEIMPDFFIRGQAEYALRDLSKEPMEPTPGVDFSTQVLYAVRFTSHVVARTADIASPASGTSHRTPLEFQILASTHPGILGPERLMNTLENCPGIFNAEHPFPFFFERTEDGDTIAHLAAESDNRLDILQWIYFKPMLRSLLFAKSNDNWSIANTAAHFGAVEVLKWLFSVPELQPLVYAPYSDDYPDDDQEPYPPQLEAWHSASANVLQALRQREFEVLDWHLTEPLLRELIFNKFRGLKLNQDTDYPIMLEWAKDRPELKKELEALGNEPDSDSTGVAPMSDE